MVSGSWDVEYGFLEEIGDELCIWGNAEERCGDLGDGDVSERSGQLLVHDAVPEWGAGVVEGGFGF